MPPILLEILDAKSASTIIVYKVYVELIIRMIFVVTFIVIYMRPEKISE